MISIRYTFRPVLSGARAPMLGRARACGRATRLPRPRASAAASAAAARDGRAMLETRPLCPGQSFRSGRLAGAVRTFPPGRPPCPKLSVRALPPEPNPQDSLGMVVPRGVNSAGLPCRCWLMCERRRCWLPVHESGWENSLCVWSVLYPKKG